MEFIVDIQDFTANNGDFIPKEISILSRNGEKLENSQTLENIQEKLSSASKIFLKGSRKKKYLHNKLNLSAEVIDLVQFPSLKIGNTINFSCFSHSSPSICALRNVFVIKNWLDIITPKFVL